MKTSKKNMVKIALLAVVFAIAFVGCDNGTNDCECPNGTIHLIGETCCDNSECTCEKNVAGTRSTVAGKATNGMVITNRYNVAEFSSLVGEVNGALDHIQLQSAERQSYIKNNIKEIRITQTTGEAPVVFGTILIVGKDMTLGEIRGCLNTWLTGKGI